MGICHGSSVLIGTKEPVLKRLIFANLGDG